MISLSSTVTHDVAQYLNEMIRPHINSRYMVKSRDEFLLKINCFVMTPAQKVVSVEVPSIFTIVPVDRTTDITTLVNKKKHFFTTLSKY